MLNNCWRLPVVVMISRGSLQQFSKFFMNSRVSVMNILNPAQVNIFSSHTPRHSNVGPPCEEKLYVTTAKALHILINRLGTKGKFSAHENCTIK